MPRYLVPYPRPRLTLASILGTRRGAHPGFRRAHYVEVLTLFSECSGGLDRVWQVSGSPFLSCSSCRKKSTRQSLASKGEETTGAIPWYSLLTRILSKQLEATGRSLIECTEIESLTIRRPGKPFHEGPEKAFPARSTRLSAIASSTKDQHIAC
jgi:hypothetical protein